MRSNDESLFARVFRAAGVLRLAARPSALGCGWSRASLVLLIGSLVSLAAAKDWHQWRGPQRDGVASEFVVPDVWPEKLHEVWRLPVGKGNSSPVGSDGKIYTLTRREGDDVVSCIDLDSGKLLWELKHAAPYEYNPGTGEHGKGPMATSVFEGGTLYTHGISGIVSAFDAEAGHLRWRREFSDEFPKTTPLYGTAQSPLVDGERLIVHVCGHDNGALVALDTKTGETLWSWAEDGPAYASPIIATFDGVRQLVTQTQRHVVGVEIDNGKLLWWIPFDVEFHQNASTPLAVDDLLIVSGYRKGIRALRPARKGDQWEAPEVWRYKRISLTMNSPVVDGNRLFGFSLQKKGHLTCLDVRTGKMLWTGPGRQGTNASLVRVDGLILLLTTDSKLFVLPADADGFDPLAEYTVSETPVWAHPALTGDYLIVKDDTTLRAFRFE